MKKRIILLLSFMFVILCLSSLTGCNAVKYNLSIVAETGGYVLTEDNTKVDSNSTNYKKGSIVSVKAVASENYVFDKWVCNNVTQYTTESIDVQINANTVCHAKFNYTGENSATITITKNGSGNVYVNGEIYTSPVILPKNKVVYLIAKNDSESTFDSFKCGDTVYANSEQGFNLTEDLTCNAIFKDIERVDFSFTNYEPEGGNIYVNGKSINGTTKFVKNTTVELNALAKAGYKFDHWTCNTNNYSTKELSLPLAANTSCSAVFVTDTNYSIIKIYDGSTLVKEDGVIKGSTFEYEIDEDNFDYYTLDNGRITSTFKDRNVKFTVSANSYVIKYYRQRYNPNNYISIGEITNGNINMIVGNLNGPIGSSFAIKPIPNMGYYFDYWEVKTTDSSHIQETRRFDEYIYNQVIKDKGDNTSIVITPVFSNVAANYAPLNVTINKENNVDATVYAPEYINISNAYPTSYYVVSSSSYYNPSSYVIAGGVNISLSGEYTLNDNYHTVPIRWSVSSVSYYITDLVINISDLSNKAIVNINSYASDFTDLGNNEYQVCVINEVCHISMPINSLHPTTFTYYYFDHYEDVYGNVFLDSKEFDTILMNDVTYYAIYKEGSVDGYLLYHLNDDNNSYSVELYNAVEMNNADIEIPSTYNEKPVTTIPAYGFAYGKDIKSLTVPATITSFGEFAFKNSNIGRIIINGNKDLTFSMFYCSEQYNIVYELTNTTLQNMLDNQFKELIGDYGYHLAMNFEEASHFSGADEQGHISNKPGEDPIPHLCIRIQPEGYTRLTLNTIVHEFRHFYQHVATTGVDMNNDSVIDLTYDDLKVKPTLNQAGAWDYLEYTEAGSVIPGDETYEKYYHNATEIDAREYAALITGYDGEHENSLSYKK